MVDAAILIADRKSTGRNEEKEIENMEQLMIKDMIKALKCIASQNEEGDCYADRENYMHMEDDNYKRLVCANGEDLVDRFSEKGVIGCPYHQNKYDCCLEDGDLFWMKDVAELLEKQIPKTIKMNDEIKYLDGEGVGWVCPGCNTVIFDFGIYDYCPHCGQRLEWRDDNIEAESN